jgi:hypothetical protein
MAEQYFWDAGTATELSLCRDLEFFVPVGLDGRFSPPVNVQSIATPLQDGGVYLGSRFESRTLTLNGYIFGANRGEVRSNFRLLSSALNAKNGEKTFRVITDDAVTRDITCIHTGDFSGTESTTGRVVFQPVSLTFFATDPFWTDSADQTLTFTAGEESGWFPLFFDLAASDIYSTATIDNDGDIEAWPIWVITGPASDIVLRNLTTGDYWSWSETLATGAILTIDTRPGHKSVLDQTGNSQMWAMDGEFWQFSTGKTNVRVELNGADSTTAVSLSYRQRYLSA